MLPGKLASYAIPYIQKGKENLDLLVCERKRCDRSGVICFFAEKGLLLHIILQDLLGGNIISRIYEVNGIPSLTLVAP